MSALHMSIGTDISEIVRTHQAGLWRYLRLLGCDEATADDLTQETFVVVLRKEFEQRNQAATARYLRTTARFLFLKALKQKRSISIGSVEVADLVWEENAAEDGGETLVQGLRACLETLDERQQSLIQMRYFKQAGRNDIARALDISVVGVKSMLRRVKEQLRQCVERRKAKA